MNFERFFFFNFLILLFTVSCSKEGKFNQTSESLPLSISERVILNYSATEVQTLIKGKVESVVADLDRLQFYSNSTCTGSVLGQALVSDFKTSGIIITTPIDTPIKLHLSTEASKNCILMELYTHEALMPKAPVFTQTIPVSPTRVTTTPGFFGTAFPSSGTIEFYDDNTCVNLISQGDVQSFSSVGIPVAVSTNAVTTVYAVVKDLIGGASACQYLTDFDHSNQISGPPQLISVSHTSPNKDSFTPIIKGSTAVGTTNVGLYNDSGCLNLLIEGDPADFLNSGFQITSTPNSTIQIYAKSVDDQNQPSVCALLTSYTHDDVDPGNPFFSSISPISPTNQTTQPLLTGLATADTELISFYDANTCLNVIGAGSKNNFESIGVAAGVQSNNLTSIYAKAFDSAGNDSVCIFFTDFTHNTVAPAAPLFGSTVPESPTNQTTTPLIKGTVSPRTLALSMYNDENCLNLIGQGTTVEYEDAGIQITAAANTVTSVYVTVSDFEGNISSCNFHTVYDHSTATAPDPGFFTTFPASPSNISSTPIIIGLADNSIETVSLYSENTCTNLLGTGTRGQYTSAGITVTLPQNSTTDIYTQAIDEYGNNSNCTLITQYIHNTVAPLDPTYLTTVPLSPNNSSITPTLTGTALDAPASQLPASVVSFYDSPSCISKLGEGAPAVFAAGGVTINVPQNAETLIYSKSFDAAGNSSSCVYLVDYTHNNLAPGAPIFLSVTPGSPSYTEDIRISGSFSASPDFMNRVSMIVYSGASCSSQLGTVNPADFETVGANISVGDNTTTSIYAVSVNEVGTLSSCSFLTSFQHFDEAPQSLTAFSNVDGSISLNWFPDVTSSPAPTYSVERSLFSGGAFSVIASGLIANNYKDLLISNNTEYFYRVFASNSTGRSKYSSEQNITVSASSANPVVSLSAAEGDARITLSWGGFPQNMVYKLSKSINSGGPFIDMGVTLTATSYTDEGLINERAYYYIVTASNPSGDSIQSNMASAVPKITSLAPSNFEFTPVASLDACGGAGGAAVSWTAPSYYSNFSLYRDTIKATTNATLITNNLSTDRCGIPANILYYYSVAAGWGLNSSSPSNVIGFYSRSAPAFTVYPGDGEVLLSWTAPSLHVDLSGLTRKYDIYSASDYSGDYTLLVNGTTSINYTDALTNGEGKFYYLQTYVTDLAGDKVYVGYPTQIRGVSADVNPAAPTNLVLSVVQNLVRLDWSPPSHYNFFKIYSASSIGGPYTQVVTATGSVITSAPVVEGMNYFKVTAQWGSNETADSNIVSYREATITGFLVAGGALDVFLDWNSIAGIQDYVVSRATDINGVFVDIGTSLTSTYVDNTASSGVGYYYKVKAQFADATQGQNSQPISGMRTDSSTPSNVSLTVLATSLIKVDWPLVSGASQYRVRLATSLGGPYINKAIVFTNTANLGGLILNTEYFVKVVAKVGATDFESLPASIWTYAKPSPPQGTPGNNQVDVTWSALAGVTNYDLLRSSDGVTYATLVSSYVSTSYLDASASNGNVYFYKIRANYLNDQFLSQQSLGISPGISSLIPANLRAENNGTGTEIELSWAAATGVTNYNVYLSTTSGSYGVPARSSTTTYNVRVTGLTTDTTYYLTVAALRGGLESGMSNEVVVIPQLEAAAPLAEFNNSSTVEVTWAAIPGAVNYDLLRSSNNIDFDLIVSGLGSGSYLDTGVDPSKTYYYRYRGYAASLAEMSLSQISNGVNLSEEPAVPIGIYLFTNATNAVSVLWSSVPSVSGYEILRSTSSGGPYVTVGNPLATETSYTDSSVSAGVRYFYVVRSLSLSKVPSPNSLEKSIELVVGPANLQASNGASSIDLTWDVIPGVVSYNIYRSSVSGGPYGLISNEAVNLYSDNEIVADKTYYYIVDGVFVDDSTTVASAEESILRSGYLSLQVAIELTDGAMSSASAGDVTFDRTKTSFDTNDYDGVTSFELEIVANNFDVINRSVHLVDDGDLIVGSVNFAGNTTSPTRIKAIITPNVGSDFYRIRLDQTNSDGQLEVYSVKLLVTQVNATKTKLYFPLLSSDQPPSNQDDNTFTHATSSQIYADFESSLRYRRAANKLSKIIDYNAWELEAVVSTTNLAEGILGLQNLNSNQIVATTETRFSSNSMQLAVIPFDEGSADFSTANENHEYSLRMRCEFECATGSVRIYKAGLWVKLENLASAQMVQRLTHYSGALNSLTDLTDTRSYVDLLQFSNPKVYFQTLVEDDFSSSGSVELISSVQDSGAVGVSTVAGSSVLADNDGVALLRSPQITIPSNNNFMTRVTPASGDLNLRDASFIIEIGN